MPWSALYASSFRVTWPALVWKIATTSDVAPQSAMSPVMSCRWKIDAGRSPSNERVAMLNPAFTRSSLTGMSMCTGSAFPRLQHIWADQGYTGTLVRWAEQEHGWRVQVVYPQLRQLKRYAPELLEEEGYEPGFRVIPRRWVVERTFSWLIRQRRLSKDYERLTSTEEVFIYLVGIRLLLARLAPA